MKIVKAKYDSPKYRFCTKYSTYVKLSKILSKFKLQASLICGYGTICEWIISK